MPPQQPKSVLWADSAAAALIYAILALKVHLRLQKPFLRQFCSFCRLLCRGLSDFQLTNPKNAHFSPLKPHAKENGHAAPICGVLRLFCGTWPRHTHVVGSGLHCLGFSLPVNDAPCYAHADRALICALAYCIEPLRLMTRGSFNTETPLPAATRKFRCHFRFKSPLRGIQSIRQFICCCFATRASLSAATALSLRAFVDHLVFTHRFTQRSLCLGRSFNNLFSIRQHSK